ncbi:unnamed protein product [Calicophoron daubneyi]|uniref:Peptidase A1 domain-containing protein n=1 Tax=Calicophoron daubneyi TaxID=300641 RepID=A0AAV2TMQ7_CALDB
MQLLWFLTAVCLQFSWTRAIEGSENNHNSNDNKTVAIPLILVYGGFHYAEIGIGTPPQNFKIFFDTWNQNTWITSTKCPADKYAMCKNHARYDAKSSSSSNETTEKFSYVEYGTTVSGTITEDNVTLGNRVVRQPFGEANATNGETLAVTTFDGSFGLGFGSTGTEKPTILQSMAYSGAITKQVYGIYARGNANGEITFGGYNKALYSGELEFTKVLSPQEWMFGINRIKFGDEDLTGEKCQGVVNDGSHHIYGPKEKVEKIYKELGCDPSKLCEVDCSKISTFPQLKITVKTTEFVIGPEDYIDKEDDKCTGRIFDLDQPTWVLGNLFLDKVYTAYDVEGAQIGFAHANPPQSTLSPTPSSTTPTKSTETTATTQKPHPTTTSAASTLVFHHKLMEFVIVMAVLKYLNL